MLLFVPFGVIVGFLVFLWVSLFFVLSLLGVVCCLAFLLFEVCPLLAFAVCLSLLFAFVGFVFSWYCLSFDPLVGFVIYLSSFL